MKCRVNMHECSESMTVNIQFLKVLVYYIGMLDIDTGKNVGKILTNLTSLSGKLTLVASSSS